MTSRQLFEKWITSRGWSQEEAAVALGCSQSMVSAIVKGVRTPNLRLAGRIAKESRNRLPMESWLAPDERPSARAPRKAA